MHPAILIAGVNRQVDPIIKYNGSCKFFIDALYRVEEVPFYSKFVDSFHHEYVLDFAKCFFHVSLDDHVSFVLDSVHVVYYIN